MKVIILEGDALATLRNLPAESVHCCVTSPPYWGLRDYGIDGQRGLEATPEEYVLNMVDIFREVRRVLRDDGTLWINLGDSYASGGRATRDPGQSTLHPAQAKGMSRQSDPIGIKPKDLIGIPWRVAFALQADGWYLRQDIIWSKPNPMPESVRDRCTKAHEYIFLLSKRERYWFDADAIAEPYAHEYRVGPPSVGKEYSSASGRNDAGEHRTGAGLGEATGTRNKRSVWTVATQPFSEAHFATFPPALIEPCILAGCPAGGTVLDPFGGAGTTGLVADRLQRNALLIELNPEYAEMARKRIRGDSPLFAEVA